MAAVSSAGAVAVAFEFEKLARVLSIDEPPSWCLEKATCTKSIDSSGWNAGWHWAMRGSFFVNG